MDITAVSAYITGTVTAAVVAIGGLLLVLAVTRKGFSWVGKMFGR